MKKLNKNAWIKIMEAVFAVLIILGITLTIVSKTNQQSNLNELVYEKQEKILNLIIENQTLRNEILSGDSLAVNSFIEKTLPPTWNFSTEILNINDAYSSHLSANEKDIYVKEIIISSNLTTYKPKKLMFFVWLGRNDVIPPGPEEFNIDIANPFNGQQITVGENILFTATHENSVGTVTCVWESDLDGEFENNLCNFNFDGLTAGTHEITVTATDSGGETATDTDSISIIIIIIGGVPISNCIELQKIGNDADYPLNGDYYLTQNIDCSATNPSDPDNAGSVWDNGGLGFDPIGTYNPINPFTGTFDGGGYDISNLYINRDKSGVGLFGHVGGNISNINLENINITGGIPSRGKPYVGGLAGVCGVEGITSYISNCSLTGGVVAGGDYSGTLLGYVAFSTTISDCHSTARLHVLRGWQLDLGGLIGVLGHCDPNYESSNSNLSGSSFSGSFSVDSNEAFIGGLVGMVFNSSISDSYATAHIISNGGGGLVGKLGYSSVYGYPCVGKIYNSYATGDVSGNSYVGGLVGLARGGAVIYNSYATGDVFGLGGVGGLVSSCYSYNGEISCNISNSFATGNVISYDYSIRRGSGGLVGSLATGMISDSYATGDVSGNYHVGGLVGDFRNVISAGGIFNSYSIGQVVWEDEYWHSDYGHIGGLIGYDQDGINIPNSYWNTETSGQSISAGGEPRITDEMTYEFASNTYEGWDFNTIWKNDSILGHYPCLQWQSGNCH